MANLKSISIGQDSTPVYDGISIVTDPDSTSVTLVAAKDTLYHYGTLTDLAVTSVEAGLCHIIFTSGATATNVSLPASVVMPSDFTAFEANKTYEISILYNRALVAEW